MWALANSSYSELPLKVEWRVRPHCVHDPLYLEGVAADVVLAQDVEAELPFLGRFDLADHVGEDLVVGDVVARRLAHALIALATEAEYVDVRVFFLHVPRQTAWTSSPMSPTGQVENMPMALG